MLFDSKSCLTMGTIMLAMASSPTTQIIVGIGWTIVSVILSFQGEGDDA